MIIRNFDLELTTPIQKLRMTTNNNSFYMKRDDLLPYSFGGNKVRKGLLYFEEITNGNYDYVVTYGSNSSNHCRVIASLSAAFHLPCLIISAIGPTESSMNSQLVKLTGANTIYSDVENVSSTIKEQLVQLKDNGYNPYFIEGGGHGVLGVRAYSDAYEEILDFERHNNLEFDYIFLASGTGGTQAGLVVGSIINKDKRNIVGVSIGRENPRGKDVIVNSVYEYLREEYDYEKIQERVIFVDDFLCGRYGEYNQAIVSTIKEVYINEGIPLDTTYIGKAFWGMQRFIDINEIHEKKILFIHTGGTPIFFDNLEEILK